LTGETRPPTRAKSIRIPNSTSKHSYSDPAQFFILIRAKCTISHHIYYHQKSLRVFRALGVRACPPGCYGALAPRQATSVTVLVSSVLARPHHRLLRCMPTWFCCAANRKEDQGLVRTWLWEIKEDGRGAETQPRIRIWIGL